METLYALIPHEKLSGCLNALASSLEIPVQLLNADGHLLEEHGKRCNYCTLLRKKIFRSNECAQIHLKAGQIAYALGESYIFSCHAELNHIAFSLVCHKTLLGTVIIGPFLMDTPDSTLLSAFAAKHQLSPALCLDLYDELQQLPIVPPPRVQQISRLAYYLFAPLLSDERLLMQERQEKLYQQSVINETIQLYKGIKANSPSTYIYEKEKKLLSKVKQCDIQSAKALLNDLLGYVLFVEGQNLAQIRERALELTVLLSRVAIEGGAPPEHILSVKPLFVAQLQKAESYEDLCFSLQEIVENFIQSIFIPDASHTNPTVRKAVEYIAAHFDQPLSIRSMAAELNISPSYFSALFFKQIGIGFHDYLTRVRVEEAKHLLTATDYPINQIAITVGYADQSSFTKAFKRITGVTPYQLR